MSDVLGVISTISFSAIVGGDSFYAMITGTNGTNISFTSDNAAVPAPTSVTIESGVQVTVKIETTAVSSLVLVTVMATTLSIEGRTQSVPLTFSVMPRVSS